MEVTNINSVLAKELLEMFLLLLPPQDLKAALLVCKSWREVGDRSKLWNWVSLKVTEENLSVMPEALRIERLKSMEKISVKAVSQDLMLAIERHPGLKMLDASWMCNGITKRGCNMSSVEPNLLARVVAKLVEVEFDNAELTSQQCKAIFRCADAGDSKLKNLALGSCNLSSVDSETLARVVAKLEGVDLSSTSLTSLQCKAIFRCAAGDSKLTNLNLDSCNLSSVDSETIARVVAKLEEVVLSFTELTSQQCQAIFRFASGDSKLKKLDLFSCNLSSVDPETMARVVAKLEEADLETTELTSQQCKAIFRCAAGDTNLKDLNLSECVLSSVDPEILARVVAKLVGVEMAATELSNQQCQAIFRCAAGDTKLNTLNLSDCDLSSVDPETLARVVAKLEEVALAYTDLSNQQCKAIFNCAAGDSKLKNLDLAHCDLSSVDSETLARFVAKLEDVIMNYTKLNSQQCKAIFQCAVADSKLKHLNLSGCDLSTVDPETQAMVVAKLEEVELDGSDSDPDSDVE